MFLKTIVQLLIASEGGVKMHSKKKGYGRQDGYEKLAPECFEHFPKNTLLRVLSDCERAMEVFFRKFLSIDLNHLVATPTTSVGASAPPPSPATVPSTPGGQGIEHLEADELDDQCKAAHVASQKAGKRSHHVVQRCCQASVWTLVAHHNR